MLMPASSEFVALCKSQVAVLTQGLGATLSIVYLTEELVEGSQAKLTPIVAYPESAGSWTSAPNSVLSPAHPNLVDLIPRLPSAALPAGSQISDSALTQEFLQPAEVKKEDAYNTPLVRQCQLVLPLMHEGVVLGFLVTAREDRPWDERERALIERIATTLSSACIMDQRSQWFEQQLSQKQRFQAEQEDIFHDLLHQFRNPLTALRTFGKLLLRRLRPGDANRDIANSIVRETERLQELLQQFDQAVELRESDLRLLTTSLAITEASPNPTPHTLLPSIELTLDPCSVAEVLEPLLASSKVIAQDRNLECYADIPPNLSPVQADAKALREVLSNLIDNALKYTPTGGQVYIQAGLQPSKAGVVPEKTPSVNTTRYQGIAISDTGPGIPPQDQAHIFERHYRGVQESTGIAGTGLGLAIAQDLVEQMQGEIQLISPAVFSWSTDSSPQTPEWMQSVSQSAPNPGLGTTFIVWLKEL